jgi:hypothetical protein
MTIANFPNAPSAVVNADRSMTIPWRNWAAGVNAVVQSNSNNSTNNAADIALLATAMGSPDASASDVIDLANVTIQGMYPISVVGSMAAGFIVSTNPNFGAVDIPLIAQVFGS